MPLLYSGQEAGLMKRLEFFEKDEIPWGTYHFERLYSTLLNLKRRNRALWNGEAGGLLERVYTSHDQLVFACLRKKHGDGVFAVFNLSGSEQTVTLNGDAYAGQYRDVFRGGEVTLTGTAEMEIEAWGYRLYETVPVEGESDVRDR
jgi:hypothetical protein